MFCQACGRRLDHATGHCPACGGYPATAPGPAWPGTSGPGPVAADSVIRIGRDDRPGFNDIVIPPGHVQVSGRHAEVLVGPGGLRIRDVGSANGTFVNGQRIGPQPVPFDLSAQIHFGSLPFDTSVLFPWLAPARPAPPAVPPTQLAREYWGVAAGPPAVLPPQRRTVFENLVEGPLFPNLGLVYGILLLVVFFLPVVVVRSEVVTAFDLLGAEDLPGRSKVPILLMPLIGMGLLVSHFAKASQIAQGWIYLVSGLVPMLFSFSPAAGRAGIGGLVAGLEARLVLFQLAYIFLAWALAYRGHRPRDALGRLLLGIGAGVLVVQYLLPVAIPGEGSRPVLFALLAAMDHAPAWGGAIILMLLLPFVMALVSFSFLADSFSPRNGPARGPLACGVLTAVYPAFVVTTALLLVVVDENAPGLLLTALWAGTLLSYVFLFPVLGGTLLLGHVRKGT